MNYNFIKLSKDGKPVGGYLIPTKYYAPRPGLIGKLLRIIGNKHGYVIKELHSEIFEKVAKITIKKDGQP